ncbi:MAG: EAL domain-containing protein [Treponema sp.]|nr:EAL domain-containing protein [Treponema sp.]
MWDYSFVLPDFIILCVFLVYYFIHPRLPIKLNKSFVFLLFVNISVLFIDVLSAMALDYREHFSVFILKLVNVLFFLLFMFRGFVFFVFTEVSLNPRKISNLSYKFAKYSILILCEGVALANFFTDTIFSISPQGLYSKESFYNVIYLCGFYYLALSYAIIIARRKAIKTSLWLSLFVFNFLLFLGYIIRFLFPSYIIMNFFALLAVIIIFISYENPMRFLSGKVAAFNKEALYSLLNELNPQDNPMIMGFVIHNYNELREIYSGSQMDRGLSLICQYLKNEFSDCLRFYCHDGRFVLVGSDDSLAEEMRKKITKRFTFSWSAGNDVDLYLEVKFVHVNACLCLNKTGILNKAIFAAFKEAEKLDKVNVVISKESLDSIQQNTHIKRAVEFAVENNEVEMFLQPLMSAKDYKLVGAEALARIRDDQGNIIPPGLFIPVAEKNGRINAMGEQMFEKACCFIHEHDIESMGLSWINVNLSPIQFLRPDLNNRFARILNKYQVEASKIHLEITEESMIDYALLQKQIQNMRNTGFQFVLDDYGSGYSNVSRLKRCPFINVKLDMELVRDYFKDRDKILPTMVQTFKQMGFSVTAEGVETLEMVELMKEIGCDYLQGFYFSKPLPSEEFAKTYGIK